MKTLCLLWGMGRRLIDMNALVVHQLPKGFQFVLSPCIGHPAFNGGGVLVLDVLDELFSGR